MRPLLRPAAADPLSPGDSLAQPLSTCTFGQLPEHPPWPLTSTPHLDPRPPACPLLQLQQSPGAYRWWEEAELRELCSAVGLQGFSRDRDNRFIMFAATKPGAGGPGGGGACWTCAAGGWGMPRGVGPLADALRFQAACCLPPPPTYQL
jgi:hypothetical protein